MTLRIGLGAAAVALALAPATAAGTGAVEALAGDGRFDVFVAAARTSGLDEVLGASREGRTIFAPTDAAFTRLPDAVFERLARAHGAGLDALVARHVVPEGPHGSDAFPERMTTLDGEALRIAREDGALVVSAGEGETARIVVANIEADGAIVHGIDTVIGADATADANGGEDAPAGPEDFAAAVAAVGAGGEGEPPVDAAPDGQDAPQFPDARPEARPGAREENHDARGGDEGAVSLSADEMTVVTLGESRSVERDRGEGRGIVTLPPQERDGRLARLAEEPEPASGAPSREDAPPDRASDPDAEGDDDPAEEETVRPQDEESGEEDRTFAFSSATVSVAELLGRAVRDRSGERVGEVEDVFLSLRTGRADRIVVAVDAGLFGLFDKRASVRPDAVTIDPLDGGLVVERSAIEEDDGGEGE